MPPSGTDAAMVNFARARIQYATDLIRSGGNLEAISAKLAQDVAKQVGNITTVNPKAATDVIEMVETSSSMEDAKGTVAGWWGNAGLSSTHLLLYLTWLGFVGFGMVGRN